MLVSFISKSCRLFICGLTPSIEFLRYFVFRSFCFDFLLHVCTSEILFELFSVELLLVFSGFTVWVFLVPIAVLSYAVLILIV